MPAISWLFDKVDCTVTPLLNHLVRGVAKTHLLRFFYIYIGVSFASFAAFVLTGVKIFQATDIMIWHKPRDAIRFAR